MTGTMSALHFCIMSSMSCTISTTSAVWLLFLGIRPLTLPIHTPSVNYQTTPIAQITPIACGPITDRSEGLLLSWIDKGPLYVLVECLYNLWPKFRHMACVAWESILLNTQRFKQTYLSPKIRVFRSPLWSKNDFSLYILQQIAQKNSTNSQCTAFIRSARVFRTNFRRIPDKIKQGLNSIFSGLLIGNFTYSHVFLSNIEYAVF